MARHSTALRVLASEMLKYLLQLHKHDRIGDEVFDLALRVLRPPYKDMDVEETSYKPKQEEEIKEEPYDESWCMPGMTTPKPTPDEP